MIIDILKDTILDSIHILPFLFLAFFLLEMATHPSKKIHIALNPFLAGVLGCIPQCAIPVLAVNLYSGGILSTGTLLALLISSTDESALILFKDPHGRKVFLPMLITKFIISVIVGYFVDVFLKDKFTPPQQAAACECHSCHHSHGVFLAALRHTAELFIYLFICSFGLGLLLELTGIDTLTRILLGGSVLQPLLTALIGLIPNCAASLLLCELYLDNLIGFSALTAGLCSSCGVGLLVLLKTKIRKKEVGKLVGFLYLASAVSGMIFSIFLQS